MKRKTKGLVIVLSAPSGCGKTTVEKALLKKMPQLKQSISATTRQRRKGEKNGKDYYFFTPAEFRSKKKEGFFIETAKVFNNYYGTPEECVKKTIEKGFDILLNIDIQGAIKLQKKRMGAVYIFLYPPSWKDLEKRLRSRGTDSHEEITLRLKEAAREFSYIDKYNYCVCNDEVHNAVEKIIRIINAEKQKVENNQEVINELRCTREID
jgi:guanylate kinase